MFIGAGISRLMGCMGWDDMANKLIKAVYPPGTATQIIDSKLDSKAKITIARKASKDTEKEKAFWEVFEEAICCNDNTDKKDIYKTIARLGTTFVTTNCDGMLISKKVTGLKVNKKYYVRVCAYKTVSGKTYYSRWSKAKTVTIKE